MAIREDRISGGKGFSIRLETEDTTGVVTAVIVQGQPGGRVSYRVWNSVTGVDIVSGSITGARTVRLPVPAIPLVESNKRPGEFYSPVSVASSWELMRGPA